MNNNQTLLVVKSSGAIILSLFLGVLSLAPYSAYAQVDRAAFKSECVLDAISKVTGGAVITNSADIIINAPSIAENGSEVGVTVMTNKLKNVEHVSIYAEKNPTPLVASYNMQKGINMEVGGRLKMRESQNIVVIVKADGQYYRASKPIKVTIGGCGGGGGAIKSISKKHCSVK